ncbi:hypothetical protein MLD38_016241 [Melastoma candidum]|uniref:Uncharacterized protein n=1 Tax=Melastoma candidum TaxID=119954 RepID=A0ACB9RK21_9MYRT|nr:hypothetical protein MLD38_016241 [Melastoma candidum]
MDRSPEEMKNLGFIGIFKESFKIIWKYKGILSLITIASILPLAVIFLAEYHYSLYLEQKLRRDEHKFYDARNDSSEKHRLMDELSSVRIKLCVLNVVYYVVLLMFSLVSTSAVVYLVACVYTGKAVTFKKVTSVIPRVWKRLALTFFWVFIINIVYHLTTLGMYVTLFAIFGRSTAMSLTIVIAVFILHFAGFVYLCIIWYLGSVISVLEKNSGINAMAKARDLIKGKGKVVSFIFILLGLVYYGVSIPYEKLVALHWSPARVITIGLPCLLLLTGLFLVGLVVQSVIYFVCKSHHYEEIDKSALSEHLDAFLPGYIPLKESKDAQQQQVYV